MASYEFTVEVYAHMRAFARFIAPAALAAAVASCMFALPAYAVDLDDLNEQYQIAVTNYEYVLNEQGRNDHEIMQTVHQISQVKEELKAAQKMSDEAAVALYKNMDGKTELIDMLLESNSLNDAINRYESYRRIEEHYLATVRKANAKQSELDALQKNLEDRKASIQQELEEARQSVEKAEQAIKDADHSDGAKFHQVQGNGSNCGATSFIVGVNVLLHEDRFTDNVAVWEGPGFNGTSTLAIGYKGTKWLEHNDLGDVIGIEDVVGDIKTADELRDELQKGHVVVISSGPGSEWQRADGKAAPLGTFPDGHFIVFYYYNDGVFYANDSSVKAEQGAGVPYTEEQMEQWMNGRSTHFAAVMYKK